MKTKLTLFVTVLAVALFGMGCASNSLVAYYPFNGNAKDESVNDNDGEVVGASLVVDRHANGGKAYGFDGIDDYINLGNGDAFNFGTSDFCISVWLKTSINQPGIYLIGKYNDLVRPAYGMGTGFVTDAYAFVAVTSSAAEFRGKVNLANGAWRHLTAVFDRDSDRLNENTSSYLRPNETRYMGLIPYIQRLTSTATESIHTGDLVALTV